MLEALLGSGLGGLDITKMMSGEGGGGLMQMLLPQLSSPAVVQMINGKLVEMADHLATSLGTTRDQIGLFAKMEKLPVRNEKGDIMMDGAGVQILEDKCIVYIYVGNEAKQKIAVDEFMKLMTQQAAQPEAK